jgi:hypothetical protein
MVDKTSLSNRTAAVIDFPQSRARQSGGQQGFCNLGPSDLVKQFGAPMRQGTGHWCSHCKGIWFGYLLEVACPKCGNRQG